MWKWKCKWKLERGGGSGSGSGCGCGRNSGLSNWEMQCETERVKLGEGGLLDSRLEVSG